MNYSKPAITIQDQIAKLKARGLRFEDEALAKSYLSYINYYRLRAYTYPFQDNSHLDHPFTTDISFEEIIKLYVFDRKLRILVFDAQEKIEISFRTQLIYHYSLAYSLVECIGNQYHSKTFLLRSNILRWLLKYFLTSKI